MAAEVTPALRGWLERRRSELNQRFLAARRRFSQLQSADFLELCRKHLPPLAEPFTAAAEPLLDAVYELLLLHAGRRLLGAQSAHAGLERLLGRTSLALRPLLLVDPRRALPMLSNAVENLGPQAEAFLEVLERVAPHAEDVDTLLNWGGVAAWRLGEARLRTFALTTLDAVPDSALLTLLELDQWPSAAAPLARAACLHHGWLRPEEVVPQAMIAAAASASTERIAAWTAEICRRAPEVPPLPSPAAAKGRVRKAATALGSLMGWTASPAAEAGGLSPADPPLTPAGAVGEFVGFGGRFTQPPTLVSAGEDDHPHRFYARSGDEVFRIDADVYGGVCRVHEESEAAPLPLAKRGPEPTLGGRTVTSWLHFGSVAICTTADSYRIRVLVPRPAPR